MGAATIYRTGGPALSVTIVDEVAVEGGAELRAGDEWAIGHGAVRATLNRRDRDAEGDQTDGWAADVALGGAAGDSFAGLVRGVLADAGVAGHANEYFAWFLRGSVQHSITDEAPATTWWSAMTGPEVTLGPVSLYAIGGIAGFRHESDGIAGGLGELGLSIRIDVFGEAIERDSTAKPSSGPQLPR